MATSQISALFLDVGGVLLTNGWDRHARARAAERFQLDIDEMNERHNLTFDTYEQGKESLDEYLHRVVFYEPRTFTADEFKQFMFAQSERLPGMIEMIVALKRRYGLKIAVVSNEGRELTLHRVSKFRLGEFVDFFIFSCFVHLRKPDPDIFRLALDVAQIPPQQVAYLEDRALFASVAGELGMHAVHHQDRETTAAALAQLGLRQDEIKGPTRSQ